MRLTITRLCVMVICFAPTVAVAVTIETVFIGNPGNIGELSGAGAGGYGADRICGAVDYTYEMGKYEITVGQYTAFLNAVAQTDTFRLFPEFTLDPYERELWHAPYIQRHGTSGNYTYTVSDEEANQPMRVVYWTNALRFANWMYNGQPTGEQDSSTTEDGSYLIDDSWPFVQRRPDATWVLPTEDEWYKAAYHKNDGPTARYWDYATASDVVDAGMANLNWPAGFTGVGSYSYPSSYGTFDQTGNVKEWTETGLGVGDGLDRFVRDLAAQDRDFLYVAWPGTPDHPVGFRLALVPEPATLNFVLMFGAVAALRGRGAAR